MEKRPLLPFSSSGTRRPPIAPSISSLSEDEEISPPLLSKLPTFKDILIFGCSEESANPNPSTADINPMKPSKNQPYRKNPNAPNVQKPFVNLPRSKTAPAMTVANDLVHSNIPKPQTTSIVRLALVLLIMYLSLGVIIYALNRNQFSGNGTHPIVDALYFCIVSMCTIGYGDITPLTPAAKVFSILFVIIGFGFIDILLSGLVNYVLDLQENFLLSMKGGSYNFTRSYFFDVKKGRMRIRMKVGLALGVVIMCIGIGISVMHFVEKLGWLDSFYLSVMSVTTVGYGDRAFKSLPGRIFASIWLLVSTLAVARAFLYLAELRIHKRHKILAKWVLDREMSVSEFLAADIDNNGCVSKSEYVIYKLKEMGKVAENDILQICKQFDRLDTSNCGKITLSDLIASHH